MGSLWTWNASATAGFASVSIFSNRTRSFQAGAIACKRQGVPRSTQGCTFVWLAKMAEAWRESLRRHPYPVRQQRWRPLRTSVAGLHGAHLNPLPATHWAPLSCSAPAHLHVFLQHFAGAAPAQFPNDSSMGADCRQGYLEPGWLRSFMPASTLHTGLAPPHSPGGVEVD